ncbi:oxidoreductase domain protein [Anaeromyxobacter sp. K]|uniref:TIM barrel protein n=1 Tax=Anaeromyxobacter sp. (strain K) TaxID=447217 RepID=UPI00015F8544|nr:TIM barrel protein [Anaeromyxobacter sp. K]ACG74098.1 oxidoreductase domain protein [Anaeromyxobacter sp. K]
MSTEAAFGRVGCSLLTFRAWDRLEDALDRARAHGFDRVDLGIVPGHCDHVDPLALGDAEREAIATAIAARGLAVSSVNLHPGDLVSDDLALVDRRIRATMRLARRIGARVLTLPPGPLVPPEQWEETADVVAARIRGYLDLAEQAGLTLSLEAPHAHTLAADVAQAARLFERVADPRITCTLDTSHVQRGNRAPLVDAPARLGVPIAHVHLRDTLRGEVTVTPGKGDCDYLPLLEALLRDGYAGDFNFELENEPSSRAIVERELGYAREYVRRILHGEPLPLESRVRRQGWFRALDTAAWTARHPREFVIAHPRLKAVLRPPVRFARHVRANWVPYRQVKYRAGWHAGWQVGRMASEIPPRPMAALPGADLAEIRVALLGCGYTGRFEHGPGFLRLPGVKVAGVCDVRPERAELLASRLGCPSFTDAARLLREVRPTLVVNCTREWTHRDTTLMCFDAGADVFCEKIMAESLASGEDMVRAAREKGRVLGVNYNWRFLPGIQRIRALRESGELGKLRMLRALSSAGVHHHVLDLVRFLGGRIRTVSGAIQDEPGTRGLERWNAYAHELLYIPSTYCVATLETEEGVGASLVSSGLLDPEGLLLTLDAVFDQGCVSLSGILDNDALGTLTASTRKPVDLRMRHGDAPAGFALSFQRSIEAFYVAYRRSGEIPVTGADALELMRVEHALVRSSETGQRIVL